MARQELPPFTPIDKTTCVMCGSRRVSARYMQRGVCVHDDFSSYEIEGPLDMDNPRQHRECRECGHAWDERTLKDSPETRAQITCDMWAPMSDPATGEFSGGQ